MHAPIRFWLCFNSSRPPSGSDRFCEQGRTGPANNSEAVGNLALVLAHTGHQDKAIQQIEKAMRLDPAPRPIFQLLAGVVLYTARENERAIPLFKTARDGLPKLNPRVSTSPRPMRIAAKGSAQNRKQPSCWSYMARQRLRTLAALSALFSCSGELRQLEHSRIPPKEIVLLYCLMDRHQLGKLGRFSFT